LFFGGQFLKITKRAQIFVLHVSTIAFTYLCILTKMGWATFWTILSEIHLITLTPMLHFMKLMCHEVDDKLKIDCFGVIVQTQYVHMSERRYLCK
jgi:hypothetical protein